MTAAEDEPLAREPEARHRRRPAGMLAKKARQGSRCRCRCCGGSANISAAGIVDSIVSRGSASVSISLNPRPKPRKERSDGHALQRERGAHLPGKGSDRERERERERGRQRSTFSFTCRRFLLIFAQTLAALTTRDSPVRPRAADEENLSRDEQRAKERRRRRQ